MAAQCRRPLSAAVPPGRGAGKLCDVKTISAACLLILCCPAAVSCAPHPPDPALATRAYPASLHQPRSVDIQVLRDGTEIELVNSTPHSYQNFDLWINQRYVRRVESLAAGQTIRLSLWDFRDELGDVINAGGLFRADEPTPVRLVEIQVDDTQPLIGLIAIPAE
jgi:hypothetical protein